MKTPKTILTIILLFVLSGTAFTQGVAINTVGADPHPSAMMDISATNMGIMVPRLTTQQRDDNVDLSGTSESVLIYNTDRKCFEFYANGNWHGMGCIDFNCEQSVTFTYFGSTYTYEIIERYYGGGEVKCWMDRNLGAAQVATSSTDAAAYGHLYQWGRSVDGHQTRSNPGTTSTISIGDTPGHNRFIRSAATYPFDWRSTANNYLWINGVNNPCPSGWRVPTETEWELEVITWSDDNSIGAFASPLKLPVAGCRYNSTLGSISSEGSWGYYWSSTASGVLSRQLRFSSSTMEFNSNYRSYGNSVRCIKD